MKKILLSCLIAVLGCGESPAQPGVSQRTRIKDLGLRSVNVEIPDKYKSTLPASFSVNLPPGYKAKIFFASSSLAKPRFMAWSPDSVLHITDMSAGTITALPDTDRDGIADEAKTVATGIFAHSIQFYQGSLYAAESDKVIRLRDLNGDGVYENKENFISNIPSGGGHSTRTIVFDAARRKLYLSVGSECNACRESNRALIEEYNDDGTGRRILATGIRNAVGMTLHPETGKLWANNNGSDNQGDTIPPEWFDIIRDGGFYGYPFAYHTGNFFNFNAAGDYKALLPIAAADSALVRSMKVPGALVHAHSAPMGVEFANASFPAEFRNGAFMALRGSWNYYGAQPLPGYRLVYIDFDGAQDTIANTVSDFVTGFQSSGGTIARPVGLTLDRRGNIYLGSDANRKFIMFIYRDSASSGFGDNTRNEDVDFSVMPNPASELISISGSLPAKLTGTIELSLHDIRGKELYRNYIEAAESFSHQIPLAGLPIGNYLCKIVAGSASAVREVRIVR